MVTGHRNEMRRQLFDTALELFAANGYSHMTHADIAAAARIGRTTFYEYFASKEDLLVQLVLERLPELVEDVLASIPHEVSTEERLAELTQRMIHFVATDEVGALLHTEVPKLEPEVQIAIADAHSDLSREFVNIYRTGVSEGRFREMPADVAARLMYEVIMAAGRVLMASPEPKQRAHDVSDSVTEFLLAGLRSSARP